MTLLPVTLSVIIICAVSCSKKPEPVSEVEVEWHEVDRGTGKNFVFLV